MGKEKEKPLVQKHAADISQHKESCKATPHRLSHIASLYTRAATEVLAETLWPTRCVICDTPGELLCEQCVLSLPYIDHWRACKHCGAPFGTVQCSECNPVSLKDFEREGLPFDRCVCATVFDERTAALVTAYKDQGERRLAKLLGDMMARTLPPDWIDDPFLSHITFIPATAAALRRRGFDHAELLARRIADDTNLSCVSLFERPANKDQRALDRKKRLANMGASIHLSTKKTPRSVLLIDDVYTTGATLTAASRALLEAGVERVCCATFARVW